MTNWKRGAVAFLVMLAMLGSPWPAPAQGMYIEPPEQKLFTEREEAAFNRIFATTSDQKTAIAALVAGAKAQITEGDRKAREILEKYRKLPESQRTPAARDEMLTKVDAVQPDADAVRKQLLADLRALLTQPQADKWKKFEYFLRREQDLVDFHGGWGRDTTNILALVDALDLTAPERAAIADLLGGYERDLDAALIDLEGAEAKLNAALTKAREAGADYGPVREEAGKPYWESANRLAQLNWQYVRRISAQLPDRAAALHKLYAQVSLPEAYSRQGYDAAVRIAPDVPDLDQAARDSVKRAVAEYTRAHDELTAKIAQMERQTRHTEGEDPAVDMTQWDALRQQRAQLAYRTSQKISAMLTSGQWNEALKRAERAANDWTAKMSR